MLMGCRDDELSSAWKPDVLLELEGKCEEEWYIGARRQLGAYCIHSKHDQKESVALLRGINVEYDLTLYYPGYTR